MRTIAFTAVRLEDFCAEYKVSLEQVWNKLTNSSNFSLVVPQFGVTEMLVNFSELCYLLGFKKKREHEECLWISLSSK